MQVNTSYFNIIRRSSKSVHRTRHSISSPRLEPNSIETKRKLERERIFKSRSEGSCRTIGSFTEERTNVCETLVYYIARESERELW